MGSVVFYRTTQRGGKSFGMMLERGNFLRIATVILVVLAVLMLALFDIIGENSIIGILSGVVGYVLGGLDRDQKNINDTNSLLKND